MDGIEPVAVAELDQPDEAAALVMNADVTLTNWSSECDGIYKQKTGFTAAAAGFDAISIFGSILQIVMQACGNKTSSQLQETASRKGLGMTMTVQSATRQVLREKHGLFAYRRFNGDAVAAAFIDSTATKSEAHFTAAKAICGVD